MDAKEEKHTAPQVSMILEAFENDDSSLFYFGLVQLLILLTISCSRCNNQFIDQYVYDTTIPKA